MIVKVPQAMGSYVTQYLTMARTQLSELAHAPGCPDFRRLESLGHNFKGSAGSFGFAELGSLGHALEVAAGARDSEAVDAALGAIERHLAAVRVEFE